MVFNESKLTRATGIPPLPLIDTTITLRYKDIDLVPDIEKSATTWMASHPDMLPGSTCRCALEGFDSRGPVLSIKATLKREASSRRPQVVSTVLLRIERIVREHGAYLAMNSGVELPATLQAS